MWVDPHVCAFTLFSNTNIFYPAWCRRLLLYCRFCRNHLSNICATTTKQECRIEFSLKFFLTKFSLYRYITRLKITWFAANTTPINLFYRKVLYRRMLITDPVHHRAAGCTRRRKDQWFESPVASHTGGFRNLKSVIPVDSSHSGSGNLELSDTPIELFMRRGLNR